MVDITEIHDKISHAFEFGPNVFTHVVSDHLIDGTVNHRYFTSINKVLHVEHFNVKVPNPLTRTFHVLLHFKFLSLNKPLEP